jgi:hypothetical protein
MASSSSGQESEPEVETNSEAVPVLDDMGLTVDRFERRLSENTSQLRMEMAQQGAQLRVEMSALRVELKTDVQDLRTEMQRGFAVVQREFALLRQEMSSHRHETSQEMSSQRHDMSREMASMRQAMATDRFELLKWAFMFWVGQFFAVGALMATMLRLFGLPR